MTCLPEIKANDFHFTCNVSAVWDGWGGMWYICKHINNEVVGSLNFIILAVLNNRQVPVLN